MGKKIKLYKCNALVIDENKSKLLGGTMFNTMADCITEYIFARNKTEATNIFKNKYQNNVHIAVSEVNISPGLTIYKNKYNFTIEDNELTLSIDSGDKR